MREKRQSHRLIDGNVVAVPGEYDEHIEIEDKDRNTTQGLVQEVQRIDEDGFIKTVKAVEISDFTKK